MGTTGGDREALLKTVEGSRVAAVIAPNMVKQIVGFQAMMAWSADTFPGLFNGYTLEINESHQKGKADTSGTAKAMVGYFNKLGIPFSVDEIRKERDPERQQAVWGIPEEYLAGHGWHTYTLISDDRTVKFQFTHNVNGREIYANGTIDAILFLNEQLGQGACGKVFSMIDVLKAGEV
jgi:4-hydroxy-tetrahydrodipicolinate reductase